MRKGDRLFRIDDIDCTVLVERASRKELLRDLGWFIDNVVNDDCDMDGENYEILYDDGTVDYIDQEYDGHKIRKQHIISIVNSNPCTYIVFGNFEMNEYGVVYASAEMEISDTNITELKGVRK